MTPIEIHPAALGFDGVASDYELGRPDYPPEAIDWLGGALDLRATATVIDLAAGTGKLTRKLLPLAGKVLAVEPVGGMRDALARSINGDEAAKIQMFEGTAESMPLDDAVADALVSAQAFHWFDGSRALPEIHRVLRPGGKVGLVWNRRDVGQPLQEAFRQIVNRHRGNTPSYVGGAWRTAFEQSPLFGPFSEAVFGFEQVLDLEGLVARGISISFIASLPDDEKRAVAEELRHLGEQNGEPIVLRYEADCFSCGRLDTK